MTHVQYVHQYGIHNMYTAPYLLAILIRLGRCGLEDSFKSFFKSDPRIFSGNSFMILKSNKLIQQQSNTEKQTIGVNQH